MRTETATRATRISSPKMRAQAESRSKIAPLIVDGISPGKHTVITPKYFAQLDVDPHYQRGKTSMVGDLVRTLQAGGLVMDPVSLCRRPWDTDTKKLWIVDGHQRVCAFQQMNMAFEALVYESDSLEAEMRFFQALNLRRAVAADLLVKSWTGPAGIMLREINADASHPLHERIHMQQGRINRTMVGATVLARGLVIAATGVSSMTRGGAQALLARLDTCLKHKEARERCLAFAQLLPAVFTELTPNLFSTVTLAMVAHERWQGSVYMPKRGTLERLRKFNWHGAVPQVQIYYPTMVGMVKKIWKE